ncbi:MAG: PorV/PorQ family protein [Candidatus Kapabacteria bacterium]|nr:PorV/PorQ family protein [Candidatus Kapabacteria bacterium]
MNHVPRVLALVVVLASINASAQQATIFPFLRSMMSARMAGLAGSTVAMPNDPSNVVLNPAVLSTLEHRRVSGTFIKHVLDINAGYATYNQELEDIGTFAVTASFTSYGSFDRANDVGTINGTFGANDVVFGVSFARDLDTLISYGITAKVLHSSLDDLASTALAVDAGLLFRFPAQRTNLGVSILNVGTQLTTYDGTHDALPLDMRIGVNHRLRGLPLLVNVSLNHLTDDVTSFFDRFLNFSLGGELYIGKVVQVRVGYDNATRNTSNVNVATQLTGLSAGIGLALPTLEFDYAMSSLGASTLLHRVSVAVRIDGQ